MNLEEVKEHFKNAKTVKCASDNEFYNIDVEGSFDAMFDRVDFEFAVKQKGEDCVVLSISNRLAEIISYKDDLEKVSEKIDTKNQFKKVADSMASLLEYKNEKYGNAVLDPLTIFSGKCKAGTRIDDKLGRIRNNKELLKNDVSDLIGYLMLTCIENGWDNFDEFKD
jgi:hypothetical protein